MLARFVSLALLVALVALVADAAPANITSPKRGKPGSGKVSRGGRQDTSDRLLTRGRAGIGYPVQEKDAGPVRKLMTADSALTWWYNWNNNAGPVIFPQGAGDNIPGFIPMIFDPSLINNADPRPALFQTLLTYNEPDLHQEATSTIVSPSEAAEQWKQFVPGIRAAHPGVKIAAPAMASDKLWLQNLFQGICPGSNAATGWAGCEFKPDLLNVDAYSKDITTFKSMVTSWHEQFGLPMIVSEFACHVFGQAPASQQAVHDFMGQTTAWMDSVDWIVKYAWFGAVRDAKWLHGVSEVNRLLDASSNVTPLGRQYMGGGNSAA